MRDFEQAHVAGNHAVCDALFHVARAQPIPGQQPVDAGPERRFQILIISVNSRMADAAVLLHCVNGLLFFIQQRHAQVRRSAVNNENHFAASHSAIACVNAFARASTAA